MSCVFSFCIFNNAKVELLAKAAAEVFLCAFQCITAGVHDVNMQVDEADFHGGVLRGGTWGLLRENHFAFSVHPYPS